MKRLSLLFLICSLFPLAQASSAQEKPAEARQLTPGQNIEREIKGGEVHVYSVGLESGQFLRAVVTSLGIDVVATLYDPDGQKLLTVDLLKYPSPEPVSFEAAKAGEYRLEIRADAAPVVHGHYELSSELKPHAQEADQQRLTAERLLIEAIDLERANTKESLQKAINKRGEALALWRKLGDKYWEAYALHYSARASDSLGQKQEALAFYSQALAIRKAIGDRIGAAATLNNMGRIYSGLDENEKAIEAHSQALSLRRTVGDRSGEADSLIGLGITYVGMSEYEKASEYFEQALAIRRAVKDSAGEGFALAALGFVCQNLGQYQKAIDYHEQALVIARAVKDRSAEGRALGNLGIAYSDLNQYEKARDYYEQALSIRREVHDRSGEGDTLNNLGAVCSKLSQFERARDYFEQALVIKRAVKDRGGEGITLNNLGTAYSDLGQYEKARDYHEQALVIMREIKDRAGEGYALGNLGTVYEHLSQYEKARDYYEQTLAIARLVRDRHSESITLNNLGNIYDGLGQYDKARDYYVQALAIDQEVKDRLREAVTLNNLGNVYAQLGHLEKARDYTERALAIKREVKDRNGEGLTLLGLGSVYTRLSEYQKARGYYEQALTIKREVKDRSGEGFTLIGLGNCYYRLGQYEKARDYLEQALAISREVKDPSSESLTLYNLMLLWSKLEQPRFAIFFGKQAVNILQEIRGNIRNLEKESQQSFLKANEDTYRTLAEALIETGRLPEAEQVLALLKDEEYSGLLRRGAEPTSDVDYSPAEAEAVKIQIQLADIGRERRELVDLNDRKALDEKGTRRLDLIERELLPKANAELRRTLDAIIKEAPDVAARTVAVKEEQSVMGYLRELGPGTVALYTVISTEKEQIDKGWIILVTPDFRKAYQIDVKDLGQTIASFREALSSPRYDPQPLAQRLYRMLFLNPQGKRPTLEADLQTYLRDQKDKTLMWSLDGVLRYVPMAALHDGDRYLVERYRNVVFTTASIVGLTHAVSRDWTALGLGVSKQYPGFPALSGAALELAAVVRDSANKNAGGVLPGRTRLDEQFTEKAMMDGLREGFAVVHIASHFSYQAARPTASFLLLGDGSHLETSKFEDSANIFEKTELLTLSACDTAYGGTGMKDANGKDAEGLAYVSQRLGAKSVIASLWPVDDIGTQVLMPLFYRLHATGLSKAEAFQKAQLALLRGEVKAAPGVSRSTQVVENGESGVGLNRYVPDPQKPYAHPYYWAPFILIGNWK